LKKQSWLVILALIVCIIIADQVSSGLIKEMVHRLRPSRNPDLENMVCLLKGYRGGKYGFVSSHAANSFGLAMLTSLFFRSRKYTIIIFLWATIVAYSRIYLGVHYPGEWKVAIPVIVSNHPDMEVVAKRFGIEFRYFPITKETKEEQEKLELGLLEEYKIDFIVLARYMQVVSESFIKHFPNRIINIHHSFLPAFVGAKPYHAAFERGVKLIGATSHYVTTELDAGPIIEQDIARVSHKDTVETLVRKGKDLEKIVLSRAVEKHIDRKILVFENKTIIFN
jgi:formyltetrahydrofolate deformylase